jgi:type IX secretion system PorP/SprF family membrane protein
MKQINKSLAICIAVFLGITMKSQDLHFSQYLETPTTLNPALLGLNYDNRVIANYRTQWGVMGKSYQTMGLSYDGGTGKKLKGKRIGYGFNIIRDVAGDAKLSSLLPSLGVSYSQ